MVEGDEAIVYVEVCKENNCSNRLVVQRHSKIKDVTWWILIGDKNNNLLGFKKISIKKRVNIKIQI
jgi:hypothetical protein